MNNRKFSHLSDVFRFTFKNQTAGKSFKVMTFVLPVVFFIAFFLLNFLLAMFSTSKEKNYVAEKVYVIDNTDTGLAKTALQATLLTKKEFGKLTVADTDKTDAAAVCNDIIGKNDPLSLVMTFELDKETKKIKVTETVPVWSTISDSEGEEILDTAVDSVMALRVMSSQIDTETVIYLLGGKVVDVHKAGEPERDLGQYLVKMLVPMLMILIIYMFLMIYGQSTGKAVAVEKNSKLMEYMLTSIKPEALVTGKVLALSFMSILQVVLWFAGGILGYIGGLLAGKVVAPDYVNVISEFIKAFMNSVSSALTPVSIIMSVIALVAAFLFYGFVAGLFGSLVSKPEELANTMGIYNLIVMVGYMGSFLTLVTENESIGTLVRIFPLTAAFRLPSEIAIGSTGYLVGGIALALLILSCVVMAIVCGKVYKARVFNKGKSITELFKKKAS